jgi:hypothetical protein
MQGRKRFEFRPFRLPHVSSGKGIVFGFAGTAEIGVEDYGVHWYASFRWAIRTTYTVFVAASLR